VRIKTSVQNAAFVASFVANFVEKWTNFPVEKATISAMIAESSRGERFDKARDKVSDKE